MNPQQFNFLGNNTLQNFQSNTGGMINQASNESEKFPGLTKQQETEIMNKANQANVTESQKNYMLNDMYQQQLRRNQIDKFAEERENTKRQLIRRAVESKDIKTSKQSKQIEKKGDVADMIRKYVSATQEIDLNKLNKVSDDQIIADFTADNPDVAYAIDDFTKSQMSSQYFSEMMGFSQFEEQEDEGFFQNILNTLKYGVEKGATGLKGLVDKGLDALEGNSNESSISMENLTAFDNYIQHKYGVSGSQLAESDKEVWQQERDLVQDNPEVLKQYMTTVSEDALNFAEGYTDTLFTATNPIMKGAFTIVGAAEQEMGGGVLTWMQEKMGGIGNVINEIPGLSNFRDTLSPEDQQRFDAFVGNVAVGLILGTKNKKNIVKDPKTFLMENLQPNQITKNFVQSVTGMPDKFLGGAESMAGNAKGLMSKANKGMEGLSERGAKKITNTATAQDKLYKAQEPRMNILSEKKNLEKKRANSDRANELILDNGYKPTNTSERLEAHQKTLNKLWGQVMKKVNEQEGITVDQSPMITALSDYIKEKKKLGVAGISSDIKALESELKSLKKMQKEGKTDIPILEAKKQVLNDLIDWKGQEASEVYKGGIKLLTQEIGKIEDSIISQIPGEFSELKRDVGALLDSYEDVFKADMKNQRKKGLGLTETYSRIEGIGDTLGGIFQLFKGDVSGVAKGLGKLALGKSLAKASDVDFLIKQGFEDLANEKGLAESQASSKTAKYQVADQTNTPEFKKWFEGSKVVDENGNPKIMYHGTPNKGFNKFKEGYFTENRQYAEKYMNPDASSIRFNKGKTNPGVYEVYLDIKNPFDTRDPIAREIFENEYYGHYGMGTPLGEKGLPDWMDGNDLQEFIMENHPEYDGLILDEGGVFSPNTSSYENDFYGGEVRDRGVSYVPFKPEQIKSATDNIGTFDKNNPDIRYQKYGVAGKGEKGITATEGLNIRNFKNGKTVQELANQYGIDTKIVDSISTPEGQRAYGMYGDRLITLSKDLKESTVPHELLHGVFDMVDNTRKTEILDGIKKRLKVDDVQAEEWLADNFSEYYRTGKFDVKGIPTTFVGKVKQFFQQIKEYIDGTYANRKEIGKLFDDIIDGKIEGEYGVYSDPKFQSVWHGSPYSFEKFDSSNMGKGEGAQAHGWGHYVAVNEDTGRHYAEMGNKYGGKNENSILVSRYMKQGYKFEDAVKNVIEDIQSDIDEFSEYGGQSTKVKQLKRQLKELNTLKEEDTKINNLYEVDIPDPIKRDTPTGSNYWEEDGRITKEQNKKILNKLLKQEYGDYSFDGLKPTSEMTEKDIDNVIEKVKSKDANLARTLELEKETAKRRFQTSFFTLGELFETQISPRLDGKELINLLSDNGFKPTVFEKLNAKDGRELYRDISYLLGSDKEASKFLESLGYDGIHYFGGRDGEAYVIFNDDALQITKHHKY